jgi:hypothetical protein
MVEGPEKEAPSQ